MRYSESTLRFNRNLTLLYVGGFFFAVVAAPTVFASAWRQEPGLLTALVVIFGLPYLVTMIRSLVLWIIHRKKAIEISELMRIAYRATEKAGIQPATVSTYHGSVLTVRRDNGGYSIDFTTVDGRTRGFSLHKEAFTDVGSPNAPVSPRIVDALADVMVGYVVNLESELFGHTAVTDTPIESRSVGKAHDLTTHRR